MHEEFDGVDIPYLPITSWLPLLLKSTFCENLQTTPKTGAK